MSCDKETLKDNIACIFSYDGSALDVEINYTLLSLNLFIASLPFHKLQRNQSIGAQSNSRMYKIVGAIASLLFVVLFQVILCLNVHCSGISIIWCSICGWVGMDFWHATDNTIARQQQLLLLTDGLAIGYYFLVAAPITTLAHILAIIVLGIPLFKINTHFFDKQSAHEYHSISEAEG